MVSEKDFYCQFHSYSNERVAKTTCGITSMAIVLSAKGVFEKYTNPQRNLDDFFFYINSLHKNNVPALKKQFQFDTKPIWITVGLGDHSEKKEDEVLENDGVFFPAYSLYRGYDHRASSSIFKSFGLSAQLQENVTASDIFNLIGSTPGSYFLASTLSKFNELNSNKKASHIVVVQRAFKNSLNEPFLEYIDCVEKSYADSIKTSSLADFDKIFNKYGTFIK